MELAKADDHTPLLASLVSADLLPLEEKLARAQTTLKDYLDLCEKTDLVEESVRAAVYLHVIPNIGPMLKNLMEKAASGDEMMDIKYKKEAIELLGKFSAFLKKGPSRLEQHLHIEKMDDRSLQAELMDFRKRLKNIPKRDFTVKNGKKERDQGLRHPKAGESSAGSGETPAGPQA